MISQFTLWLEANPHWLAITIFLIGCLECLAVLGILTPGTVMMFSLGVLAGSGALELWQTIALAYAGGLLGDFVSYFLGRRFHQHIPRLPVLRTHPQWLVHAQNYFNRYGVASLLVGHFIGPLRPMLPMVAGMLKMPFARFTFVSLIAAAAWAVAYTLPGWTAGAALRLSLPHGFWGAAGIVCAVIAVIVLLVAQCSLTERRISSPLACLLCAGAVIALLIGYPHLSALDNGLMTLVQNERNPVLDQLVVALTILGDMKVQIAAGALLVTLLMCVKQYRAGLFVAGCMLLTAAATTALKPLLARARPDILLQPLESYSLPSGHSSAAFAFFLAVGVLAGRGGSARTRLTWLLVASLPAFAIALSRIYLGVHWPTDVLAGTLLAVTCCALSLTLVQWRQPMQPLPARIWWLITPACLALFSALVVWRLPTALLLYRY